MRTCTTAPQRRSTPANRSSWMLHSCATASGNNSSTSRGVSTATFTIVHCSAPEAVLRQRVAARAAARNDASEAGLDVLQRQPGYWEPFDVQQQSVVVPVDTSDSDAIDRTLEQLAHRDRN